MMWWHGEWNGWAWLAMSASMLVFWALVIWGVVSVARLGGHQGGATDPDRILRERLARGEIDAEEFDQRRELLRR